MSQTLAEFLLARIAEDKRTAQEAVDPGYRWTADEADVFEHGDLNDPERCQHHDAGKPNLCEDARLLQVDSAFAHDRDEAVATHIAHWDPVRVLAECDAKRRIVEQVEDVKWTGSYAVRDTVLRLLALSYAGHPDYREEWRL